MAKLRKANAYRRLERPYTRISKYRKKSFIRSRPHSNIVKFETGNTRKKFPIYLDLVSKSNIQIRHNAMESARQTSTRTLEKVLGKSGFHFKIRLYPHHILRENPLAAGAGADRTSTGMSHGFGKSISSAARVKKGQTFVTVGVAKKDLALAKNALRKAACKFPCSFSVVVRETA